MSELPKGWVETELGAISTKPQYGWTSKAGDVGEIKYLRTTDLSKGKVNWETVPYCVSEPDDIQKYQVRKNDILISRAGSVGFSYRIEEEPKNAVFASYLIRFKPVLVEPKLIEYYLKSADYWNSISGVSAGIAVQNINASKLAGLSFPLPPLAEQERIVEKLDALFASLDVIKDKLDLIPELLKNFRQQVLTQAVTGKLTEEWRVGNDLIDPQSIIDAMRKKRKDLENEKKLRREKAVLEISSLEIDFELSYKWAACRWVDLLELHNLSMKRGPFGSALKKDFFVSEGIRVFEQYNPINDDPHFERYYVSQEKFEELEAFEAKEGDLLISCSGVTLGRITELPEGIKRGIINQALLKLTLNKEVISNTYFKLLFRSEFMQSRIFDNAKGSAIPNMVGVNVLKQMVLPLPSIEEQQEIVRRVEELFAIADRVEAQYSSLKEKVDKLPQVILAKAFRGELVEQHEGDESAEVLLERIRAERASQSKPTKGKKYKVKESELSIAAEEGEGYGTNS